MTVTSDPMTIYKYKYAYYTFPQWRWMVVRDLVCDTPSPVASVAELCRLGCNINLNYHKAPRLWRNHHRVDVATGRRL